MRGKLIFEKFHVLATKATMSHQNTPFEYEYKKTYIIKEFSLTGSMKDDVPISEAFTYQQKNHSINCFVCLRHLCQILCRNK